MSDRSLRGGITVSLVRGSLPPSLELTAFCCTKKITSELLLLGHKHCFAMAFVALSPFHLNEYLCASCYLLLAD
ncbi:unnamed protein product [Somion occarium]|uniref:Uncharacterized protein n=1 Tax=Somion occarium TaxID=3059160 RepID=A0ABP1DWV8_9APHY